jgi:hypothetical protein
MWRRDLGDKQDFRDKYTSTDPEVFQLRLALVKNYPYNHDYGKET